MRLFLKHAASRVCVYRSLKTALIVGTALGLINHYDEIIHGNLTTTNVFQMLITYLVPYSVATFGAAMQGRHMELEELKGIREAENDSPAGKTTNRHRAGGC